MRGWWSARPKPKVWDNAPQRAFERPAAAEGEAASTPPAPGALFEPRPLEHVPVPTVAASPAPPAPAPATPSYQSPAVESTRPVKFTAPASPAPPALDQQAEFLRLLEVVTSMCDHVIEYIEADRAERQQMMDTLSELGRIITEGAQTAVAALAESASASSPALDSPAPPAEPASSEPWAFARPNTNTGTQIDWRERVVGGSMPAGPEPHVDLVGAETDLVPVLHLDATSGGAEIAVEVRGRFGDRWVDGFEICEVMTTPSGPRYRLRRQHDGVVLPELFDAANIRHVTPGRIATREAVTPEPAPTETTTDITADITTDVTTDITTDAAQTTAERLRRERSMESHPSGSEPGPNGLNGSEGYWSRS